MLIALIVTEPPLAMPWQWIPLLGWFAVIALGWPVALPIWLLRCV